MNTKTMTIEELRAMKNEIENEIESRNNIERTKDLKVAREKYEKWMIQLQNTLKKVKISHVLRILEACDVAALLQTIKSYIDIPDEEITWDMVTWDVIGRVFKEELEPQLHYPRFDPHGEYQALFDVATIVGEIGGQNERRLED